MSPAPPIVTAVTALLIVCGSAQSRSHTRGYVPCGRSSHSKLATLTSEVRPRCRRMSPPPPATCNQGCAWRRSSACRRNEYVGSFDYAPEGGGRTQCCHNQGVVVDTGGCEKRSSGGRLRRNEVAVSVNVDVADDPSGRLAASRTRRSGGKVLKRYRLASDEEIAARRRLLRKGRRARRQYSACRKRGGRTMRSRRRCAQAKRRALVEVGVSASGNIGSLRVDIQVRGSMTVCEARPAPGRCAEPAGTRPPPPVVATDGPEQGAECDYEHIPCGDGGCVPMDKFCDGRSDCADGSDEDICDDGGIYTEY